jgi:ribosome-associated toxin RatA of RatAB toxin-antitoxin module
LECIRRNALVPFSAAQMYDLVNAVEVYPQWFTWCTSTNVIERTEQQMVAQLNLSVAGLRFEFTTKNLLQPPSKIDLSLIQGPLTKLQGHWRFEPLRKNACKVELALDLEYGSLVALAMRLGFSRLADQLVDDFVAVARREYAKV